MNKLLLLVYIWIGITSTIIGQEVDTTNVDSAAVVLVSSDSIISKPDSLIYWKNSGRFSLNLQQIALKNWAAGGNSSFAIGGQVEGSAYYEKDERVWDNNIKVGYGVIRKGGEGNSFEKTDDFIILISKYSQKFTKKVMMSAGVYFRTQMDEGFKDQKNSSGELERVFISNFMAPGYLQTSLGLTFSATEKIFATISPFTGRFTFVLDDHLSDIGAFGVEPGKRIRSEAGISLVGKFEKVILENVKLQANANLFSNYETFPNTVVNIETILNLRVNNFISSNISSQLIYDDKVIIVREDGSVGKEVQLKNVINLGFTIGF